MVGAMEQFCLSDRAAGRAVPGCGAILSAPVLDAQWLHARAGAASTALAIFVQEGAAVKELVAGLYFRSDGKTVNLEVSPALAYDDLHCKMSNTIPFVHILSN